MNLDLGSRASHQLRLQLPADMYQIVGRKELVQLLQSHVAGKNSANGDGTVLAIAEQLRRNGLRQHARNHLYFLQYSMMLFGQHGPGRRKFALARSDTATNQGKGLAGQYRHQRLGKRVRWRQCRWRRIVKGALQAACKFINHRPIRLRPHYTANKPPGTNGFANGAMRIAGLMEKPLQLDDRRLRLIRRADHLRDPIQQPILAIPLRKDDNQPGFGAAERNVDQPLSIRTPPCQDCRFLLFLSGIQELVASVRRIEDDSMAFAALRAVDCADGDVP